MADGMRGKHQASARVCSTKSGVNQRKHQWRIWRGGINGGDSNRSSVTITKAKRQRVRVYYMVA